MPNRALDWFRQALRDLDQADESRRTGRHEWACFAAEQAAEKAVKALHLHLGQEAWGHFEHYGPLQSDEALRYAREIIEFARSQMA